MPEAFPLSNVRLDDGPFRKQLDIHIRYLLMLDPDRLLAPYLRQAALPTKALPYGGWESRDVSGHSLGHYLSALSYVYGSTRDDRFANRIHYIVDELYGCLEADGEGYALPVEKAPLADLASGRLEASPFALNGVWVPFYTVHKLLAGLRDGYRFGEYDLALIVERAVCDWIKNVLRSLDGAQIQEMLRAEHGGMNEVLADLSSDTGDPSYLELAARGFHHLAVLDPIMRGEDRLDGLHGNTQIPKLVGIAREYELNANPVYRKAAESFWENVTQRRSYVIGGHGESEHFFPPESFPEKLTPNTCETCNTYNMVKLTGHLFGWEPLAKHMDFIERASINHLLANIGQKPGEFGYFLGLGSVGIKTFSSTFDSWWCCVGTGLENPGRYIEHVYYREPDALWINLFMGSTLDWADKGVRITQKTTFPEEDTTKMTFECARPAQFRVNLRHPYWCSSPDISVNGDPVSVSTAPSSYIALDRIWRSGDTIVAHFPMHLRAEPLPHSNDKIVAFMYGPLALAAVVPDEPGVPNPANRRYSEHLGSRGKTDVQPPVLVASDIQTALDQMAPTGWFGEFRSEGGLVKPEDLTFRPFYQIYEEQYAVYFPVITPGEWKVKEVSLFAEQERKRMKDAATVDSVTPGYQQPEVEHNLKSENSGIQDFAGRKCRTAVSGGGWFSYELAVDPALPNSLVAAFWGGVWHERNVDIFVDETQVASQRLAVNKPGEFFDETYTIPFRLTSGKTKVTVRFVYGLFEQNDDDKASGLFGLTIIRNDGSAPV